MQANKPNDSQLQALVPKMLETLKNLQNSNDWIKDQEKPCQTFYKQNGNRIIAKGIKVIPFTTEQILQMLEEEENFKKLNQQCIQCKALHKVPGKFKIVYTQMKLPWPLDNRQTVMILAKHKQNSDKVYLFNKSINYPYPQSKGVTRAETYIGGFILERVGQKQTKITTFGDFDPKGSIPDMIKKEISKKRSQAPAKIQEKLKQKYGK